MLPLLSDQLINTADGSGAVTSACVRRFKLPRLTIIDNLYEFEVLVNSLKKLEHHNNLKKGNYNIVAAEPPINAEQHKLFDQAHKFKSDVYTLIDPGKFETITDDIVLHNYTKFSNFLSNCVQ